MIKASIKQCGNGKALYWCCEEDNKTPQYIFKDEDWKKIKLLKFENKLDLLAYLKMRGY